MFAGKSTELVRRIKLAKVSKYSFAVYNPAIDTRYGEGQICNHDKDSLITSLPVENSLALLNDVVGRKNVEKVFIDEAQFFDKGIIKIVDFLVKELGINVTFSGLLHDFRGEVFGPMGELVASAHRVTSLESICTFDLSDGNICNSPAYFTQRLIDGKPANYDSPVVLVGGAESYTARCAEHWFVPNRPRVNIDTLLK